MHVKILLGRSFIDKNLSIQLGNIIVQSIIEPISPVLNQFKELTEEFGNVEKDSVMEGRNMTMFLSPKQD